MPRFGYLGDKPGKGKSKRKKAKTPHPAPDGRTPGQTAERVEAVYVRKETVRAVWSEVKRDGGESVSELVEDLLLRWLKDRA